MEITAAYYDGPHAKMLWDGARDKEADVEPWFGINPDASLVEYQKKSNKQYGSNCLLLVVVPLDLTTAEELEFLLNALTLSENSSIIGIYVAGRFPISTEVAGGCRVLPIKEFR